MSKINDGGPAFPRPGANWMDKENRAMGCDAQLGMTLRDYFAAKAMQALVGAEFRHEFTVEDDASYAYKMADAMLKAREEGGAA